MLALSATSCDSINPAEEIFPYSIQCLIVSGDTEQTCFVYKTLKKYEQSNNLFVQNAAITVSNQQNESRNYILVNDTLKRNRLYKSSTGFDVLPNTSYKLIANIGATTITGFVTTPDTFSILEVKKIQSDVLYERAIQVTWNKSKNAHYYKVRFINPWETSPGKVYEQEWYFETEGTSIVLSATPTTNNDSSTVEIIAADKNYYTATRLHYQQAGVENAYGFFSGGVKRVKKFVVK